MNSTTTLTVGAVGASGIGDFINYLLSLRGIPAMPPGAMTGLLTVLAGGYHLLALFFPKLKGGA